MPTPLRLERYFFTKTSVEANPNFKGEIGGQLAEPKLDMVPLVSKDDASRYQIVLKVSSNDLGPYKFAVDVVGFFRADPSLPEEKRGLVVINGASILYSSLREYLLMITSRGPWGSAMLPATSFAHLAPKPKAKTSAHKHNAATNISVPK